MYNSYKTSSGLCCDLDGNLFVNDTQHMHGRRFFFLTSIGSYIMQSEKEKKIIKTR